MIHHFDIRWDRLVPGRPPVVLLGGIAVVRSLGLAGIAAIVASADRTEPALASRYCIGHCRLPPFDRSDAACAVLIALRQALARRLAAPIPLMCSNDDALEWLLTVRRRLQPHFRFLVSGPEVAGALVAKDRFQAFGRARGLPLPAELAWDGEGPGTLRSARGHVMMKPKVKTDWHHSEVCRTLFDGTGKARVFDSSADVLGHPTVGRFREQLSFQEYIPGSERELLSFHGFADQRSRLLASFVGRKIRTYPAEMGESSFIELVHEPALHRLGQDIVRRCPLQGVFKMDFKRDPRDGRWYLLEINGRYNLWHYLGAANGINLPAIAYEYLVFDRRPPPSPYRTSLRWLSWHLDARAYRELAARGELSLARWLWSVMRVRKVYNLFAWRDPGPWWHWHRTHFPRRWQKGPKHVLGALRQWLSSAS